MTTQQVRSAALIGFVLVGTLLVGFDLKTGSTAPLATPRTLSEVPATSNSLADTRAQNSPTVAVHPQDERFVALANRIDAPLFSCSLNVSGDGGRGWVPADPVPELPEGAERCYAPEVAFDASGRLFYLFVGLAGPGNTPTGVYLTSSEDGARSFSPPKEILGEGNYQVRMLIDTSMGDEGRMHLAWLKTATAPPTGGFPPTDNPIVTAYSDDGGETFSEPQRISDPDRQRVVGPQLALGPDGAVHVSYFDLQDDVRDYQGLQGPVYEGDWAVLTTRSLDGGESFEPSVVVDDAVRPRDRVILIFTMPPPALGAGPDGEVYLAWEDAREGDSDIFFSRSEDRGASWSDPIRLNDDQVGNGSTQYLPQLAVAPNGRVDVIFYDRREDPRDLFNHVFYATAEGGVAFGSNTRLTSKSGPARSGQRYLVPSSRNRNDIGMRLALRASDTATLGAWADTRNAAISPYQDVFTTTVQHAIPRSRSMLWAGGSIIALSGLGLLLSLIRRRSSG